VGAPDANATAQRESDAGLIRERGNCEVYEDDDIVTQIRH
jgi:hypothetical protein